MYYLIKKNIDHKIEYTDLEIGIGEFKKYLLQTYSGT